MTDYRHAPAETLFFPKVLTSDGSCRQPEVWNRGDYMLLSQTELDRCVEIFVEARDMARGALLHEIESLRRDAEREAERDRPSASPRVEDGETLFRKK